MAGYRLDAPTNDVPGRAVKAEVFDTNGQTYSTATTVYNALDQATWISQYQALI